MYVNRIRFDTWIWGGIGYHNPNLKYNTAEAAQKAAEHWLFIRCRNTLLQLNRNDAA